MQKRFDALGEVFFALCKKADTPVSLSLWMQFKYGCESITKPSFYVRDYLEGSSTTFAMDYACLSYLKKYKGFAFAIDKEAVALQSFISSEILCRESNRRIRESRNLPIKADIASVIYLAKRKIAKLLGPFSLFSIEPFFGWGPGATSSIARRRALVDTKMMTVPIHVSSRAIGVFDSMLKLDLHWSAALLGIEPSGPFSYIKGMYQPDDECKITTVDKDAVTDRTIAIEPTGNLFLQKGVGGFIRMVLRRVGIDLNDQTWNQRLASKAFAEFLATIDLSAASDSLCRELVYELLPYDWASFLDAIRSWRCKMPNGESVVLEKFSSMGNGFTFELESLIFWALASSLNERPSPRGIPSVYGDDIICLAEDAPQLIEVLNFAGFQVNKTKSYTSGLFYESCGSHFFEGCDVTPIYQKEVVTFGSELIRAHNRVFRWYERRGIENPPGAYRRFAKGKLASCLLPCGVDGDDGFLTTTDEFIQNQRRPNRNRGFSCLVITQPTRSLPGMESALLANTLRLNHDYNPSGDSEPFRFVLPEHFLPHQRPEDAGNVTVVVATPEKERERGLAFARRWIIPPGYCPIE